MAVVDIFKSLQYIMTKLYLLVALLAVLNLVGCGDGDVHIDPDGWDDLTINELDVMEIQDGSQVKINYVGRLKDDTVFDTNIEEVAKDNDLYTSRRQYQPLSFQIWAGQMIPGLEQWLKWLSEGDSDSLTIQPKQAYGAKSDDKLRKLTVWDKIFDQTGEILEIHDEHVLVDYNQPMAGKTLEFEVELIKNHSNNNKVADGDTIEVNYVGRFEDGEIFDTNIEEVAKENDKHNPRKSYQPLKFNVGKWEMIQGFDAGVIGMEEWETKNLTLAPSEAYGESDENKIHEVTVGDMVSQQWGQVEEILSDAVVIDFNHPLAGKTLIFDVDVLEVSS